MIQVFQNGFISCSRSLRKFFSYLLLLIKWENNKRLITFSFIFTVISIPFIISLFQTYFLEQGTLFLENYKDISNPLISETGLAIISTFISAVLGISVPISLSVISSIDSKYDLNGLTSEFIREPIFKTLIYCSFGNAFLLIFNLLGYNSIFIIVTLILSTVSLIVFYIYIGKIITYSSNSKLKLKLQKDLTKKIKDFKISTVSKKILIEDILIKLEQFCAFSIKEVDSGNFIEAKHSITFISNSFKNIVFDSEILDDKLYELFNYRTSNSSANNNTVRSFFEIFFESFYNIWKPSYLSENAELSVVIVDKLIEIYELSLFSKKHHSVAHSALYIFKLISHYGTKKKTLELDLSVSKACFSWYQRFLYRVSEKLDPLPNNYDGFITKMRT